ncbi:uncharacterized protein METZ01_LOCUS410040 [marine metagenome]|uniref:Uncharacterized protein n=1 Tax=marine metagenome TaxID=408172 RepID=A0A382WE48_9ZZZZ
MNPYVGPNPGNFILLLSSNMAVPSSESPKLHDSSTLVWTRLQASVGGFVSLAL